MISHLITLRRLALSASLWGAAGLVSAQTVQIQDTFTRDDNTLLGTSEVGNAGYFESTNANIAASEENIAEIFANELIVFGAEGFFGSGPGVASLNANLSDFNATATMRFEGLFRGANTTSSNGGGFLLRRSGEDDAIPARTEGLVEAYMLPSGGLFVRETNNGALNNLYSLTDPNIFGLGGSNNATYGAPGTLPTTFGGLPFDVNGNGVLENDEPFQFGVSLAGNALEIRVNNELILSRTTARSAPVNPQSTFGIIKNRFAAASPTNDAANIAVDNLVLSGTPYAVPIVKHTGSNNPAAERWFASTGAAGVTNNGPVTDGATLAWNIQDTSTAAGSASNWQYTINQDQLADIPTEGWRMKSSVRVVDANDIPDGGIELSVFPSSRLGYTIWLGSDASGNAIAGEFSGVIGGTPAIALGRTAIITGSGYHDYEMVYDPSTNTVDLFADNVLVIDNIVPTDRGVNPALNRVLWGANSSAGVGNANYSSVEFIVGDQVETFTADFNNDGMVDAADLAEWRGDFGVNPDSDADGDGDSDGQDFLAWQRQLGSGAPSSTATAAVPEPSFGMLAGFAAIAGIPFLHRKKD